MDDAELGQVATPTAIARAVCRWALPPTDGTPRVLDPAVGDGVFARVSADRLAALGTDRPLDHLAAVDVDGEALETTRDVLADRDGDPALVHGSFLECSPDELGRFDAVVGNPPYLRQEAIDADHYRAHLDALGPAGGTPYRDGERAIGGRSDAYVYFVTQATRFLRDGGRLGYVVPAKWLATRYGESLQRFLFDHYRVEAVVGFDARAFTDELVDTVLLLCERRFEEAKRRAAPTRFVRVGEHLSPDVLQAAVTADVDATRESGPLVRDGESHRTAAVSQAGLADRETGKLAPHLSAPVELVGLLDHPALVPVGELGSVHRGVMTGANDFFLLDAGSKTATAIDDRFLRPAVRSIRDVEGRVVGTPPERYLFDVHEYVETARRDSGTGDTESTVKAALSRDGFDAALAHVERGEAAGYHERRSCATREVWFDLGPLDAPAVLHPKFFDRRVAVLHNPDGLVPTNAVDCVSLEQGVPELPALGAMNSTVYAALLECWGRTEGGGALQLMTYEVERVPVLDPRRLSRRAREQLADATRALLDGEAGARERVDRAVVDALDLDLGVERLRALREGMVGRRVEGAEASVLVGD